MQLKIEMIYFSDWILTSTVYNLADIHYFRLDSLPALPFTAVMFLIGTLMGIGVQLLDNSSDHLTMTTTMWVNIDSELLLLVFLPGLIFKDAYGMNVHLFRVGFTQCFIFAFPLVLIGTLLTAAFAMYVFPYNWNFNLAMTFGSM